MKRPTRVSLWRSAILLVLATALSGCGIGSLIGAPTVEPWIPPPTSTAQPEPTTTVTAEPTTVTAEPTEQLATVQRGGFIRTLLLSGQVAPQLQLEMAFRENGVLRTIYVEPGMQVSSGTLLAELDLGTLNDQLHQAKVVVVQDAVTIKRAAEEGQIAVRQAEINLDEAQAALDTLKAPPLASEIITARAMLDKAQATLARTRNDASSTKSKAERAYLNAVDALARLRNEQINTEQNLQQAEDSKLRGSLIDRLKELESEILDAENQVAVTRIDYDTAIGNEIAAVKAAEADVNLAQLSLNRLLSGPTPQELANANLAVRRAQVQLDGARQLARSDPSLEKVLASSQLAVKQIESQIEARRIYAPINGTIISVDAMASFPVQAEIPVVRLMGDSGLEVIVSGVTGPDSVYLSAGMPASLQFTRYPDHPVSGRVSQIQAATSGTVMSVLHIAYDAVDLALSVGEPAQVQIDLGKDNDVLWLPLDAVRRDSGDYVLVRNGEDVRQVSVLVGTITTAQVEILDGLQEGDTVILP